MQSWKLLYLKPLIKLNTRTRAVQYDFAVQASADIFFSFLSSQVVVAGGLVYKLKCDRDCLYVVNV